VEGFNKKKRKHPSEPLPHTKKPGGETWGYDFITGWTIKGVPRKDFNGLRQSVEGKKEKMKRRSFPVEKGRERVRKKMRGNPGGSPESV